MSRFTAPICMQVRKSRSASGTASIISSAASLTSTLTPSCTSSLPFPHRNVYECQRPLTSIPTHKACQWRQRPLVRHQNAHLRRATRRPRRSEPHHGRQHRQAVRRQSGSVPSTTSPGSASRTRGAAIGAEFRERGVSVALGPMMNLARSAAAARKR